MCAEYPVMKTSACCYYMYIDRIFIGAKQLATVANIECMHMVGDLSGGSRNSERGFPLVRPQTLNKF